MIRFEHVSKKFKGNTVLKDLSFNIKRGELVTIIGSSGCGKTTSLKMINRLIQPSSGKIFIDDEDIATKDVIKLRRNMGYVIQQTGLFPHMTIRENIEMIPKMEKVDAGATAQRTMELMAMVGLDETFLDRYPNELSGGQQQRIGVARAFALDPDIILMDEPFSALDPMTKSSLQDELSDLQSELKKTIVFVTHDMDEAIKIADRICIMDQGKIIQYDTPEQILKNPANDFVSDFVGKNRLWTSPEFIKAKDIMIEHPVICSTNITLFRALEKMRTSKVDSLMVVANKTNVLAGVLTAKYARKYEDKSLPVSHMMKTDFEHVKPEDNIIDIITSFNDTDISSIPVLDEQGILAGLITKGSLVTTLSQQYMEDEVN